MSLQDRMLASMSAMASTKATFENRLRAYHVCCEAKDWAAVDVARLEVVTALELNLDAVAMAYRTLQQAGESNGR